MGISKMKDELHARLWSAQQRWFALKDQGLTKHELKMQGIRERGDMFHATRGILFTGATRLAYGQELKRPVILYSRFQGSPPSPQAANNQEWYPLVEEYRTAVRAFIYTSPLPIPGIQPDPNTRTH